MHYTPRVFDFLAGRLVLRSLLVFSSGEMRVPRQIITCSKRPVVVVVVVVVVAVVVTAPAVVVSLVTCIR